MSINFLTANPVSPQVVVSSLESITTPEFHSAQRNNLLTFVATELRNDILEFIKNAPSLSWPPKAADLLNEERKGTASVKRFLCYLLHDIDSHRKTTKRTENYI